jgi:hypothetical protein
MGLLDHHEDFLAARGVDPKVAAARGYESVNTPGALLAEQFSHAAAARVPGLLIPVADVHGIRRFAQYRPDKPRSLNGKPAKYEIPPKTRLVLDVPRGVAGKLTEPGVPLWITESPVKADAAVSAGLACIATFGVWGWKGTNAKGGRAALPDWDSIAVNGRPVFLVPDSDVAENPNVAHAARRLGGYLAARDAIVRYVLLPSGPGGAKQGLDDFLARTGQDIDALLMLATEELPPAAATSPSAPRAHLHTPPAQPPPWAADQDILAKVVCTQQVCMGLTGEQRTSKLVYLTFTSRLLPEPVNTVIKGLSATGKSFTIECNERLMPAEAIFVMTSMSERALIYLEGGERALSHRTVVLYEAAPLREGRDKAEENMTAYVVRSLLSEGKLVYPVTVKEPGGKLVTRTITKEGPTNLITSTTALSLHPENETRMLSLPTDDSEAQTRRVLLTIAADIKRREHDLSEWHDYQRWLAAGNCDVTVPYASCLAAQIPANAVRLRRDFTAVLQLVKTHTLMHRANRATEGGQIIATAYDYEAVWSLLADLLAEQVGATVPPAVREAVDVVNRLETAEGVKVAAVAAQLGMERSAASRRLASARSRGYLVNLESKRGQPARYALDAPMPGEVAVLPEPEAVCTAHPCAHLDAHPEPAGQECFCTGVCRCARGAEGAGRCAVCSEPMDSALTDAGYTIHPGCDPEDDREQPPPWESDQPPDDW